MTPLEQLDELLELFERFGHEHYGENVSQQHHALQCAAMAVRDGEPDQLIAAALLHDVGHLLELRDAVSYAESRAADRRHEVLGAAWLSSVFPSPVVRPIALHVAAKRWRCTLDPSYTAGLSECSATSLVLQGGLLSIYERRAVESDPAFPAALALRERDDAGKVDGLEVRPLSAYVPMLRALVVHPEG